MAHRPPHRPQPAERFARTGLPGLAALLAAALAAPQPHAEPRPLAALLPACQACHGVQGISAGGDEREIPNLAGQPRAYLAKQLAAFRAGERKNELMAAIAAQLDEREIAALAAYWSAQPAAPTVDAPQHPAAAATVASRMSFPAAFPAGFTLYDRAVLDADGRSVRRYANAAAIEAARADAPLPDGAVVIVVNHAAPAAAGGVGAVLSYAAMERRAGRGLAVPELLRNGDWDYAVFGPDRIRREINVAACLACHRPLAASSHVFTAPALRAAARSASAAG